MLHALTYQADMQQQGSGLTQEIICLARMNASDLPGGDKHGCIPEDPEEASYVPDAATWKLLRIASNTRRSHPHLEQFGTQVWYNHSVRRVQQSETKAQVRRMIQSASTHDY